MDKQQLRKENESTAKKTSHFSNLIEKLNFGNITNSLILIFLGFIANNILNQNENIATIKADIQNLKENRQGDKGDLSYRINNLYQVVANNIERTIVNSNNIVALQTWKQSIEAILPKEISIEEERKKKQ